MKINFTLLPACKKIWICIICIILSFNYSCVKNSPEVIDYTKNEYNTKLHNINYNASLLSDSILQFAITIDNNNSNKAIKIDENFEIDITKDIFNNNIEDILSSKASKTRYDSMSPDELKEICNSIKGMIAETIESLSLEEIKSPKIQGLYLSLSFVRKILSNKLEVTRNLGKNLTRNKLLSSLENTNGVSQFSQPLFEQDIYEGAVLGLSSFAFTEDIIVDKSALSLVIAEDLAQMLVDNKGLYVFQEVLNNISQQTFTLKYLLREMDIYKEAHPELIRNINNMPGWWPKGSDHGCCGNYSGKCWFWHPICYIHDKMCINCKPKLFCLPACKPGKYSNFDSPNPFTFIEDVLDPNNFSIYFPLPLPSTITYNTVGIRMTQHFTTTIFYNSDDKKYYSDSAFQYILPDAFYKFPDDPIVGKYYKMVNGIISNTQILNLK